MMGLWQGNSQSCSRFSSMFFHHLSPFLSAKKSFSSSPCGIQRCPPDQMKCLILPRTNRISSKLGDAHEACKGRCLGSILIRRLNKLSWLLFRVKDAAQIWSTHDCITWSHYAERVDSKHSLVIAFQYFEELGLLWTITERAGLKVQVKSRDSEALYRILPLSRYLF